MIEKIGEIFFVPQAKQWIDSTSLMFPFSLFREHLPTTTNENAPLIGRRLAYWCLLFVLVKGRIRWLSSRMALIRRSDIEKMFEANPYNPLFMLSCKVCVDLPRKNLGAPICTIVFHRTRVYRRARL